MLTNIKLIPNSLTYITKTGLFMKMIFKVYEKLSQFTLILFTTNKIKICSRLYLVINKIKISKEYL